jgi:hypothetical protein
VKPRNSLLLELLAALLLMAFCIAPSKQGSDEVKVKRAYLSGGMR